MKYTYTRIDNSTTINDDPNEPMDLVEVKLFIQNFLLRVGYGVGNSKVAAMFRELANKWDTNMETKFNFNSAICTSREQSERLLSLGLKKETADMSIGHTGLLYPYPHREEEDRVFIPAWSLHRLIELYKCVGDTSLWNLDDVTYDRLIQCIGLAIKHNSFNKEYFEDKK